MSGQLRRLARAERHAALRIGQATFPSTTGQGNFSAGRIVIGLQDEFRAFNAGDGTVGQNIDAPGGIAVKRRPPRGPLSPGNDAALSGGRISISVKGPKGRTLLSDQRRTSRELPVRSWSPVWSVWLVWVSTQVAAPAGISSAVPCSSMMASSAIGWAVARGDRTRIAAMKMARHAACRNVVQVIAINAGASESNRYFVSLCFNAGKGINAARFVVACSLRGNTCMVEFSDTQPSFF